MAEHAHGPGEDPVTWRQEDTDRWLRVADARERGLAPVLELLIAAAALRPGEHVLDVGCGTGPTTGAAARAVRPGGTVTGLDLAPELVAEAQRRVSEPETRWVSGDATTVDLPPGAFDVVISRFGVMFFADPVAAFGHLAELVRPGGRLAMAVWPPRHEVEQFEVPHAAARSALDAAGVDYEQPDPGRGPFSLGSATALRDLLTGTGWSQVEVVTHTRPLPVGGPDADLVEVARGLLDVGQSATLLQEAPHEVREDAVRRLVRDLEERVTETGLTLGATVRLATGVRR